MKENAAFERTLAQRRDTFDMFGHTTEAFAEAVEEAGNQKTAGEKGAGYLAAGSAGAAVAVGALMSPLHAIDNIQKAVMEAQAGNTRGAVFAAAGAVVDVATGEAGALRT